MGNTGSSSSGDDHGENGIMGEKANAQVFLAKGSAFVVDALNCGSLDDADEEEDTTHQTRTGQYNSQNHHSNNHTPRKQLSQFFSRIQNTEELCAMSSPAHSNIGGMNSEFDDEYEEFRPRVTLDDAEHPLPSQQPQQQQPQPQHRPTTNNQSNHDGTNKNNNNTSDAASQLFAKALVSEVTNNPNTMTPAAMAEREKRLLKAQEKARQLTYTSSGDPSKGSNATAASSHTAARKIPVGTPGEGVGPASVLESLAHVLTGNAELGRHPFSTTTSSNTTNHNHSKSPSMTSSSVLPPNSLSENRAAQQSATASTCGTPTGKHTVTIGLSLSRRSSIGHPDTVTRQTAFDFNELQDREYKYVSSTDDSGWRAGGGERGGSGHMTETNTTTTSTAGGASPSSSTSVQNNHNSHNPPETPNTQQQQQQDHFKIAAADTVHIPIIHIDADSPQAVDAIISALAQGEVFIPHMAIIPEALSVNGVSPPDLVVRFGCERNEDLPPDEWANWCLEFMHNQLYEYFHGMGARWMKRPFSITLAKKVRWKTVKHMNRYFAHAERVIDAWREKGPQYLDPQLAYIEGGATPEEVARPHGIYLLRNGVPTNYFAPNFDPPYTTKMTRSLLLNVLGKSWDKKRREWTSKPIPRLVTPSMLVSAMCGCADNQSGGFLATEATNVDYSKGPRSTLLPEEAAIRSASPRDYGRMEQPRRPNTFSTTSKRSRTPSPTTRSPVSLSKDPNMSSFRKPSNDPDGLSTRQNQQAFASPSSRKNPVAPPPKGTYEGEEATTTATGHDDARRTNCAGLQPSMTDDRSEANMSCAISAFSAASSTRYGRPPTPEQPRSLLPELHNQNSEQENTNPADSDDRMEALNDLGQPSLVHTASAEKFMKQQQFKRGQLVVDDEKKEDPTALASDEDWLDALGKPLTSPKTYDPTSTGEVMESLERERQRQNELLALAHAQTSSRSSRSDTRLHVLAGAILEEAQNPGIKPSSPSFRNSYHSKNSVSEARSSGMRSSKSPGLRKTDSGTSGVSIGVSLEYSFDSTLVGETSVSGTTHTSTVGGSTVGSSLLGQQYAADGSTVNSASRGRIMHEVVMEGSRSGEDTNGNGSSLLSNSVSAEVSTEDTVPSDADLFAVGWAKALDPKSGSYYYFTLDRTQIVWDNPLAPPGVSGSQSEESLVGANPNRAALI